MKQKLLYTVLAVAIASSLVAPAAAQNETLGPEFNNSENVGVGAESDTPAGNSSGGFAGNLGEDFGEEIIEAFVKEFRAVSVELINGLVEYITNTPDIRPNPSVQEIYRLTLSVTYVLGFLAFTVTGYLYLIGPILGYNYQQIQPVIPRILAALVFASISPILLQYSVDLAEALVHAFLDQKSESNAADILGISAGVGAGMLIAWAVEAAVLTTLVSMFIIRNIYILFIAAVSPLLAISWALPMTKTYADEFISAYWTALMMAPVDVLALRFSMTLMQADGVTLGQSASNWIIGLASLILLVLLPYQLYSASRTAAAKGSKFKENSKQRVDEFRETDRYERMGRWKNRQIRRAKHRVRRDPFKTDGGTNQRENEDDEDDDDRVIWSGDNR